VPVLSNSKHERFAQEIAKGSSASAAYVIAGYAKNDSNAARLNGNEQVRSRVEELLKAGAEKAGVTIQRVVEELAKIGFSDIRKIVEWSGSEVADEQDGADGEGGEPKLIVRAANIVKLISSDVVDNDTAAAISEISQTREGALKVKLHDKLSALEKLGKHLGMFKEQHEHSGPGGGPIPVDNGFTELVGALEGVARARARGASGAGQVAEPGEAGADHA
jgi:phage terminase small subunit